MVYEDEDEYALWSDKVWSPSPPPPHFRQVFVAKGRQQFHVQGINPNSLGSIVPVNVY
jgi:hypothetical protein